MPKIYVCNAKYVENTEQYRELLVFEFMLLILLQYQMFLLKTIHVLCGVGVINPTNVTWLKSRGGLRVQLI